MSPETRDSAFQIGECLVTSHVIQTGTLCDSQDAFSTDNEVALEFRLITLDRFFQLKCHLFVPNGLSSCQLIREQSILMMNQSTKHNSSFSA